MLQRRQLCERNQTFVIDGKCADSDELTGSLTFLGPDLVEELAEIQFDHVGIFPYYPEEGTPAVFDRYSNAFLKIYFPIPEGRENEIARKVLIAHLQAGNSYGIQLKEAHAKFAQPELGPWVEGSRTVGENWRPAVLEGWEPPAH